MVSIPTRYRKNKNQNTPARSIAVVSSSTIVCVVSPATIGKKTSYGKDEKTNATLPCPPAKTTLSPTPYAGVVVALPNVGVVGRKANNHPRNCRLWVTNLNTCRDGNEVETKLSPPNRGLAAHDSSKNTMHQQQQCKRGTPSMHMGCLTLSNNVASAILLQS